MLGMTFVALAVALVLGISFGRRSVRTPELYWALCGAGLVATTAFMIGGYTWYDEVFLLGYVLANPPKLGGDSVRSPGGAWWAIFVIFCLYSIVEGIRGLIYFTDIGVGDPIQKFRWIALFVLILVVALKAKQLADSGVKPRDTAALITRAALCFLILYLEKQ